MTNTVDNHVVNMGFNNKQFEAGVQTTLQSLKDLKSGLNLEGATKGLLNLQDVGRSFTLGNIASNVQNISSNFSAMGVVAFTVLQNITNMALGAATQLFKMATGVDQIKAGFSEYEAGMDATQTIVANTGESLDTVTKKMKELSDYANLTKFSYGDMTSAVGQFTSQGVSLDKSVVSIKGLYNVVAMTGGDALKAKGAVTQLSQAIAGGRVQAMDWMSVVSAGVAKPLQTEIMAVAKAHGIAVDDIIKKNGSFRDSLKDGWVTSDILVEAFSHFTGDLSAEQLKTMGIVQQAGTQYALLTKEQVKSLNLSKDQLNALKLNEVTAAAIGADYTAEQLKNLGLTQDQIKLVTKYYSEAEKTLSTSSKTTSGIGDAEAQRIEKLGKTAFDSATKLKTFSQLKDTLLSNVVTSWSQSFKIVAGDLNEATDLWTSIGSTIGNVLQQSGDARNQMLQDWKDAGGRTALVNALNNAMTGLMNILDPIKKAFEKIFPPILGTQLAALSKGLETLTSKFKVSDETAALLQKTFEGIFGIFDLGITIISKVVGKVGSLIGRLNFNLPTGKGILAFTAGLADGILKIRDSIKYTDGLSKTLKRLAPYYDQVKARVKDFIVLLSPYFDQVRAFLSPITQSLQGSVNALTPILDKVKGRFLGFLTNVSTNMPAFLASVGSTFEKIKGFLKTTFGNVDTSGIKNFFESVRTGFGPGLRNFIEGAGKVFLWLKDVMKEIWPIVTKIANTIGGNLSKLGQKIKEGLGKITKSDIESGIGLGLLATLGLSIKKFLDKGSGALDGVTGILGGIQGALKSWQDNLKAKTLMTIALSIAILAASLIALSLVPADQLSLALVSISTMFAELVLSMKQLDKAKGINNNVGMLVGLAAAILILTVAIKILSGMDPKELSKGLIAVGAMLTEIGVFMTKVKNMGNFSQTAKGLVTLSISMMLMGFALKIIGNLSWEEIIKSLTTLGITLAGVNKMMTTIKTTLVTKIAASMVILATSMIILGVAMKVLGSVSWESIAKSLIAIGVSMSVFVLSLNNLKGIRNINKIASSIVILSAAMIVFGVAMRVLSGLSWEDAAKGLVTIGVAMTVFTLALNTIKEKGVQQKADAIVAISASILILSLAMRVIGGMSWEEMAKAGVAIAALMGMIVLALNLLKGSSTAKGAAAIVVIAIALGMLAPILILLGSMPWQVIALGLGALLGIFFVLGVAGLTLGPMIPILIGLAQVMMLFAAAAAITGLAMTLFAGGLAILAVSGAAGAAAVVLIMKAILPIFPEIAKGIADGLIAFAGALATGGPAIMTAVATLIKSFLDMLLTLIPDFADTALQLILTLGTQLSAAFPELVEIGFELLISLLTGIRNNINQITQIGIDIVVEFLDAIATKLPDVINSAAELLIAFINGLADAIDNYSELIYQAAKKLALAIINGIVNGIKNGIIDVANAVKKLAEDAIEAIKKALNINSPSKVFMKIAESIPEGMVKGINNTGYMVDNAVTDLAKSTLSTFSDVIAKISDGLEDNISIQPTIRPVVDLSDIIAGGKKTNKIFGDASINASLTMSKLSSISNGMNSSKNVEGTINQPQTAGPTNISLTQNNYSPKALSRIDLYRQTRNQLNSMKMLVEHK